MKKILIYEPSILSRNIGDFIIIDAVREQLHTIFPNDMFFNTITQDRMPKRTYKLNNECDYSFIGGTNILSSHMGKRKLWKFKDTLYINNLILMGVGWLTYQNKPDLYTKYIFKHILHPELLHSVRDSYTEKKMISAGITNVINTGCPTTWKLTPEHCLHIPYKKADNVIFTLTDYDRDIKNDSLLIKILKSNYKKVYFWPQGSDDLEYIRLLTNISEINIIGGNIKSYNTLLENNIELDYVGTRLHGGIRALQYFRRTILIIIDNRAREKASDFNFKTIERKNISKDLKTLIYSDFPTKININLKNINIWKQQFIKQYQL